MCNKVKDKPLLLKKWGKMKAHTVCPWMDGWMDAAHVVLTGKSQGNLLVSTFKFIHVLLFH